MSKPRDISQLSEAEQVIMLAKRAYHVEYARNNAVKARARATQWRLDNPGRKLEANRKWAKDNPEKTQQAAIKSRATNPVQIRENHARYVSKDPDRARKVKRDWAELNRKENNTKRRVLLASNPSRRLADNLRARTSAAIRQGSAAGSRGGSAVRDLGCSIPELKARLEAQFLPGMNWENWSLRGWHIDHIKPLASFDLTNRDQFLQACHFTNLQPLWAFDNLSKGARCLAVQPETLPQTQAA